MVIMNCSDNKVRIAFVIGHLTHGGAEKQLCLLCKGLDRNRFAPVVLCLSKTPHPWGKRISKLGIPIVYIPRLSRFDYLRLLKLAWYFYKYKPELVISSLHSANVYSWLAKIVYFKKTQHVAQIRSKEDKMGRFVKFLNVMAFNSSDVIITNSRSLNTFVKTYFRQQGREIITISNGIEIKESIRMENGSGKVHIGTIGKDTPAKNLGLFLNLALYLLTDQENLHFHLCGRNLGEDSRLFRMIPEGYHSSFKFYGEVDDPEAVFQRLDIYISTSRSEGSPNAIMEAMVYGLPVIATDVGGVSELVHDGDTGFLVSPGDINGLVEYCKLLINDLNLRRKMGKRGKNYISNNYSDGKMVRGFEKIFESLNENFM